MMSFPCDICEADKGHKPDCPNSEEFKAYVRKVCGTAAIAIAVKPTEKAMKSKDNEAPKDMFYLKFNSPKRVNGLLTGETEAKDASWRQGNPKPLIPSDQVTMLEAHGLALVHLACIFPSFCPLDKAYASRYKTEASWFGDIAKMLFANL